MHPSIPDISISQDFLDGGNLIFGKTIESQEPLLDPVLEN
jgi:hypothetical protein